uniref:Uncharacterized protein n=1 Tax=Arundo donax TaxID=35708 RepID=A0A0A9B4B7_ARUDO
MCLLHLFGLAQRVDQPVVIGQLGFEPKTAHLLKCLHSLLDLPRAGIPPDDELECVLGQQAPAPHGLHQAPH